MNSTSNLASDIHLESSVARLNNLLDFALVFKAFGNN